MSNSTGGTKILQRPKGDASLAKDYQFIDSDLTLISSDKASFKIHSYQLQAAR
jgi:hypothetical protein